MKALATALAVLAAAPAALADPGELDVSFAQGGYTTLAGGGSEPGRDGAVLTGGRILVVSGTAARRLTSAGRVDRRYRGGSAAMRGDAWGFATRSGGRALVGVVGARALSVRALRSDGRTDRGFGGGDGLISLPDASRQARLLRARGGGAYVLDGSLSTLPARPLHLRRITPQGRLDRAFGVKLLTTPDGRPLAQVTAAATAPDGRLFIAGVPQGDPVEPVLLRLLPDSSLDPTFGSDGAVTLPIAPSVLGVQRGAGIVHAIGIDLAGRVLGARVVASGIVDPAWRDGGREPLWTDAARPTDAFVDGSNRLVVARTSSDSRPGLMRLEDDGKLDATFGRDGILELPGAGDGAVVHRVMSSPNNRLVALGGTGDGAIAVWRVDA